MTETKFKNYAVIKRYEAEDAEFQDWHRRPDDYNSIYEILMTLINDHELSAEAAEWCQSATFGEIYEFGNGEIEIMEID